MAPAAKCRKLPEGVQAEALASTAGNPATLSAGEGWYPRNPTGTGESPGDGGTKGEKPSAVAGSMAGEAAESETRFALGLDLAAAAAAAAVAAAAAIAAAADSPPFLRCS